MKDFSEGKSKNQAGGLKNGQGTNFRKITSAEIIRDGQVL
jgi:hypothetical protein